MKKVCPRCKLPQEGIYECEYCGLIIDKYEKAPVKKKGAGITEKIKNPRVIKIIKVVAVICLALALLFGLIEPDYPLGIIIIVGLPIFAIVGFATYVFIATCGTMLLDWLAETTDRKEIKRGFFGFILILLFYYVLYLLIKLADKLPE